MTQHLGGDLGNSCVCLVKCILGPDESSPFLMLDHVVEMANFFIPNTIDTGLALGPMCLSVRVRGLTIGHPS